MQETAPTQQPMPTKNSNSEYSVGMPVLEVSQTESATPGSSTHAVVEAPATTPMLEAPEPTELLEAPEQPTGLIEAPETVEALPAESSADTPTIPTETEASVAPVDAPVESADLADARADVEAATTPAVETAAPEVSVSPVEPAETAAPAPAPTPAAKPSFFQRLFHRN